MVDFHELLALLNRIVAEWDASEGRNVSTLTIDDARELLVQAGWLERDQQAV